MGPGQMYQIALPAAVEKQAAVQNYVHTHFFTPKYKPDLMVQHNN
jgi:hypothetical protein